MMKVWQERKRYYFCTRFNSEVHSGFGGRFFCWVLFSDRKDERVGLAGNKFQKIPEKVLVEQKRFLPLPPRKERRRPREGAGRELAGE